MSEICFEMVYFVSSAELAESVSFCVRKVDFTALVR